MNLTQLIKNKCLNFFIYDTTVRQMLFWCQNNNNQSTETTIDNIWEYDGLEIKRVYYPLMHNTHNIEEQVHSKADIYQIHFLQMKKCHF